MSKLSTWLRKKAGVPEIRIAVDKVAVEAARARFLDYGAKRGVPAAVLVELWDEAVKALRLKIA